MGRNVNSFFNNDPLRSPTSIAQSAAKVLPSSQPLPPLGEDNNGTPIVTAEATLSQDESHVVNNIDNNVTTNNDDPNCPVCREEVLEGQPGINCNSCKIWFHKSCLHMTEERFEELNGTDESWFCVLCCAIKANKIKWGEMEGEETIRKCISNTYIEITKWRKNLFLLPRGKAGSDFLEEKARLINLFVNNTKWARVSMAMENIFGPLLLQKPSKNSRARDNAIYLRRRLQLWSDGKVEELIAEAQEIQKRLDKQIKKKSEIKEKSFCSLVLLGKLRQAMKFINHEDITLGVHPLSDTIKDLLIQKHPKSKEADEEILLPDTTPEPLPVVFEEIDASKVYRAAMQLEGSGGPSLLDAEGWKHMLCSKSYGNASVNLCQAIADLAKKLCREEVHPDSLTEFVACRLIPLDKGSDKWGNPGVRPIGIGEILRRLVGKVVVSNIREDIIKAAGPLQTCAGLKAGIEATVHAMRTIYEDDGTEGILLVDAENAFNQLNRRAALHNIKQLCPNFYRYLSNTYQLPAKMIVNDLNGRNDDIHSEEGSTQGDVTAMGMYAVGTRPLLNKLGEVVDPQQCKQCWYADDSASAGKIREMRKWWDEMNRLGPKFGYYPKPSKTILIIKDPDMLDYAVEIFGDTGISIGTEGERHLGAAIGSQDFKERYVKKKVDKWIQDIEQISDIAKNDPQIAYASYTKALCMRWCFVQRTISGISHLFQPLEEVIREKFIPAIVGRNISDLERRILALPVRFGGLGIQNPVETADREYEISVKITSNLKEIICNQEYNLDNLNEEAVRETINQTKQEKNQRFTQEFERVKSQVSQDLKRCLELAQEKGAGSWLTALPIKALGYVLNMQDFRDSLCLRYGWKIPNTPLFCSCSKRNDVDHALTCTTGGYVYMRHNRIRDTEAAILKEVCKDVRIEPELLPVETENGERAAKERLDVSAVGIWSPMERSFLDVRVVHPNSPSYRDKSISQIYEQHEKQKKKKYNQRIVQIEKATFTPLVFSTTGGMAPECARYHKKVAELIANKTKEDYSKVVSHLRTKLRFTLLKSTLLGVRGARGKSKESNVKISELDFNTIPDLQTYET